MGMEGEGRKKRCIEWVWEGKEGGRDALNGFEIGKEGERYALKWCGRGRREGKMN